MVQCTRPPPFTQLNICIHRKYTTTHTRTRAFKFVHKTLSKIKPQRTESFGRGPFLYACASSAGDEDHPPVRRFCAPLPFSTIINIFLSKRKNLYKHMYMRLFCSASSMCVNSFHFLFCFIRFIAASRGFRSMCCVVLYTKIFFRSDCAEYWDGVKAGWRHHKLMKTIAMFGRSLLPLVRVVCG